MERKMSCFFEFYQMYKRERNERKIRGKRKQSDSFGFGRKWIEENEKKEMRRREGQRKEKISFYIFFFIKWNQEYIHTFIETFSFSI